jgi:hypothetical protein
MAALAQTDIVAVWERGGRRPAWNKALIVLAPVFADRSPAELAALSIGERNAHLLALRAETIGPVMHALVNCPRCGEPLEFEQRIDELLHDYQAPPASEFAFSWAGFRGRYRLLDSRDLAAASRDEATAPQALIGRALVEVTKDDRPVAAADLPPPLLEALARDLAERDRLTLIPIALACAACQHVWNASLEIVSFLWSELERQAKAILEDVVTIAQAYGWGEGAILAMSPGRRQYYLEAIG